MHFFMKAWKGKEVNWKRFFRHYNSVVDWPTCAFYKDLMKEFPDVKVLLNVRDPEKWYDSMYETIYAIQPVFPWWFPRIVRRLHDEIIWDGSLKGVFEDKEKAVAVYRDYIEEVKKMVPADRLLVYDVSQGWAPLCAFLGVPVPIGQPFPYKNDRRSFKRVILLLKILNWLLPAVVFILVMIFILSLFIF
jgi:hypothetical protein